MMKIFAFFCAIFATFFGISNSRPSPEQGKYFEGDMLLFQSTNRLGIIPKEWLWPNATLIYEFDPLLNSLKKTVFQQAVQWFQAQTCIRFKQRTTEEHYVNIASRDGCWSYVGRNPGGQSQDLSKLIRDFTVSIGDGCELTGIVAHELMHALGFMHEQMRPDRDNFVAIHLENVQPGMEFNFGMADQNFFSTYDLPYDYSSIMHYGKDYFSKNGFDTIVPKQTNAVIGQRDKFSEIDVVRLNKLYGCEATTTTTTTSISQASTSKTPIDTCIDQIPSCKSLIDLYTQNPSTAALSCSTKLNTAWWFANCQKSCGWCDEVPMESCADQSPQICDYYANYFADLGQPQYICDPQSKYWWFENCADSCGWCKSA